MECMKQYQILYQSTDNIAQAFETDDIDAVCEVASDRDSAGHFLQANIHRHHQMPMALGSGATTLEHKCQALATKFAHEAASFQHLREVCSQVIGVTVDMGTESGVPTALGGDAVAYLPSWMRKLDCMQADCGLDALPVVSDAIFPSSLISPGLDHIANNLQDAMDKELPGWPEWLPGFKALVHLLSHRHLLQRLVARCIRGTAHEPLCKIFETCVSPVASWRWGTIVKTLPDVLRLEKALRVVWDEGKFRQGNEELEGNSQDDVLDCCLITATVHDRKWWSYGQMISQLHYVGHFASAWGSGCRCHEWLGGATKHAGQLEILENARQSLSLQHSGCDGSKFECPLKGKRAPELAAGKLFEAVAKAAEAARAEAIIACAGLSEEQSLG